MKNPNRVTFVLLGLSGCLGAGQASAAFYGYSYVAENDTYVSVPTGTDLVVPLYLQETNYTFGSTSSLLVDEEGLSQAGLSVSFTSGDDTTAISSISANDAFDSPIDVQSSATSAVIWEAALFSPSVVAGLQNNGVSRVFLGTLTIHTGLLANQTTTFTINPYNLSSGTSYSSLSQYNLDNNVDPANPDGTAALFDSAQGTFLTITTAVPEPLFASSAALGALPLLMRRRSRSR